MEKAAAADHSPKLESPPLGGKVFNTRRMQCAMQKEKGLISSGKGEADARNWSSPQERSSPAAPCIFRRVTFAFGIFLKEKSIHSCLFLKVMKVPKVHKT